MKKKQQIKEFFRELSVGLILCIIVFALLLIGGIVISLFPEKISEIFPVEVIALIGFFALLILLYIVSKIIEVVRKIKEKSSNTDNFATQEENDYEEKQ